MTEHAPELDVTHARQARRGRHAFVILVCSLALGLIALAAVYAFYSGSMSRLRVEREARAQSVAGQAVHPTTTTTGG